MDSLGSAGATRPRTLAALAAAIGGATIAIVVLSVLVWLARGMVEMPVSFGSTPIGVLGLVISPICYAGVGGVLAARLPTNPIGWLFLAVGVALGIMLPVNLLVAAAHESFRPADDLVVWLAWARTAFGTPTVLAAAVIAVQVFPDGRTLGGWWRLGPWMGAAGGVVLLLATGLDPVGLIPYPSIPNPVALSYAARDPLTVARFVAVAILIVSAVVAVASVWQRHQRGSPVLRAQLRWIVLAVAITVAVAVPFVVARYLLRVTDPTGEALAAAAQIAACAFPLAAALAISRYRLFDVDIVIGRSLVYLPTMAVLGGLYTAGIALFQRLFVAVTGSESDVAVLMTILVVASAFTPVRRALEGVVHRRFAGDGGQDPPRAEVEGAHERNTAAGSVAAHDLRHPPLHAQLVAVDERGAVACPLGHDRTLRDCLRCPGLVAVAGTDDVAVVCNPAATR